MRYAELLQAGFILSLEGIHGVGKSTVGRLLVARLGGLGVEFVLCADQTATETGRLVRQVNLNLINKLDSITELFLVASARREAFVHVIRPRLDHGEAILTERFVDSFFAFSLARGTPPDLVRTVAHFVADGRKSDLSILLNCPADVAWCWLLCVRVAPVPLVVTPFLHYKGGCLDVTFSMSHLFDFHYV